MTLVHAAAIAIALAFPIHGQCSDAPSGVTGKRLIRETVPPLSTIVTIEVGERVLIERDYEVETFTRIHVKPKDPAKDVVPLFNAPSFSATLATELRRGTELIRIADVGNWVKIRDPNQRLGWVHKGELGTTAVEALTSRPGNIQRSLEYTGRIDNRLTLSYKEFTETADGVFIRPAFTQDYSFDLSQGSEIGVKGARIRVIQANNTGLKYEVLKSFGR